MRKEDCYLLGKITRRHGFSGNVILKLDTDQPEQYNKMESIFIEINGLLVPFFIEKQKWNKDNALILTFKNTSEAQIDQIIAKDVYLPLDTLPKLTGNNFYFHEVMGYEILDLQGISYGKIQSVNDRAAQPFFILLHDEKEVVVPVIKSWIKELRRDSKILIMDLPEGLLNVYLEDN